MGNWHRKQNELARQSRLTYIDSIPSRILHGIDGQVNDTGNEDDGDESRW